MIDVSQFLRESKRLRERREICEAIHATAPIHSCSCSPKHILSGEGAIFFHMKCPLPSQH
eukprot:7530817-Pyramimonas_sp.AAC.2